MRANLVVLVSIVLIVGLAAPVAGANGPLHHPEMNCAYPMTVEDATGTAVTVDAPPERIVTTTPSAAQTLWEFDADEKVVGLTQFALYLDGADEKTLVTDADGIVEVETVIDLEPDLVLAPNTTTTETIDQLREAGLTVYHFPRVADLDGVAANTARIGELTNECAAAEDTIAWMNAELAIIDEVIEDAEPPGVMYLFFDFTVGDHTFIDEIITAAGAENLAATAGIEGYQQISDEIIIEQNPEWIILNTEDPAMPESAAIDETTAGQTGQFVTIEIENLNQPAPRNVLAIQTLVEHLHPEAYAEASGATEDAADDTATVTDEPDAIPGFGVIVAILALAAVALGGLTRRR